MRDRIVRFITRLRDRIQEALKPRAPQAGVRRIPAFLVLESLSKAAQPRREAPTCRRHGGALRAGSVAVVGFADAEANSSRKVRGRGIRRRGPPRDARKYARSRPHRVLANA